ncbi:MAG TPA: hypothetical protein VMW91_02545 [Desulfosporosinus sp.]|nr:hypothetical protein [Desulfosporosinus sp.]
MLSQLRNFLWLGSPEICASLGTVLGLALLQVWGTVLDLHSYFLVVTNVVAKPMNEMKLQREPFKPTPKKHTLKALVNVQYHLHSSIDAIPLSVLPKLRNFLWLGSPRGFGTMPGPCGAVCVFDANTL